MNEYTWACLHLQYVCVVKLDNITFLAQNRPTGVYSFPDLCSQRSFLFSIPYIFSFYIMIIIDSLAIVPYK